MGASQVLSTAAIWSFRMAAILISIPCRCEKLLYRSHSDRTHYHLWHSLPIYPRRDSFSSERGSFNISAVSITFYLVLDFVYGLPIVYPHICCFIFSHSNSDAFVRRQVRIFYWTQYQLNRRRLMHHQWHDVWLECVPTPNWFRRIHPSLIFITSLMRWWIYSQWIHDLLVSSPLLPFIVQVSVLWRPSLDRGLHLGDCC